MFHPERAETGPRCCPGLGEVVGGVVGLGGCLGEVGAGWFCSFEFFRLQLVENLVGQGVLGATAGNFLKFGICNLGLNFPQVGSCANGWPVCKRFAPTLKVSPCAQTFGLCANRLRGALRAVAPFLC